MKRFVEGMDRGHSTLFPECLEGWICEDNPVRVIDVLVGGFDLAELRFYGVIPRPPAGLRTVAVVDRFKLAAVDGDARLRQKAYLSANDDELRAHLAYRRPVEYDALAPASQSHGLVQRRRDCHDDTNALAEQLPVPSPVLHAPQEGRDDFNMRRMAKLIDRFDPRHFIAAGA
jgi:hypothetical protein